jgi:hypothetical protein
MDHEQRIRDLEHRLAMLEGRVAIAEANRLGAHPSTLGACFKCGIGRTAMGYACGRADCPYAAYALSGSGGAA